MAVGNGNPGVSKLAGVINKRAGAHTADAENNLKIDFGQIQGDMSLLTNTFPIAIPKGEYSVLRHVGGLSLKTEYTGVGDHGSHRHQVDLPKLKKGDHVLVAWVESDPVVLDVIVSSSKL